MVKTSSVLSVLFLYLAATAFAGPETGLAKTTASAPKVPPGRADFSGATVFLELTALLEKDQEPAPEQWDRLFATPGYAVLVKRDRPRDFYAERFRLAFMPSMRAECEARVKKDTGFNAQFLLHYVRARDMRKDIERRLEELRQMDIHGRAIARARALLPATAGAEAPTVAFVIFAPDARGYDPVVIDVLFSLDDKSRFEDFVAHEFHHWYRGRMVGLNQDAETLWVIDQIHAEGVADLVDRAGLPKKPAESLSPREKDYMRFYGETPAFLRKLDEALAKMADMKTGRRELAEELQRAVPLSGHPTGLYMAGLILEVHGREALVGTVPNPFAFFRLYDRAAVKKAGAAPRFSAKALRFLRDLEKRYLD